MNPVDHAVAEAAVKAKKAQMAHMKEDGIGPRPTSGASRVVAALIWLAAIGTLAALIYVR